MQHTLSTDHPSVKLYALYQYRVAAFTSCISLAEPQYVPPQGVPQPPLHHPLHTSGRVVKGEGSDSDGATLMVRQLRRCKGEGATCIRCVAV